MPGQGIDSLAVDLGSVANAVGQIGARAARVKEVEERLKALGAAADVAAKDASKVTAELDRMAAASARDAKKVASEKKSADKEAFSKAKAASNKQKATANEAAKRANDANDAMQEATESGLAAAAAIALAATAAIAKVALALAEFAVRAGEFKKSAVDSFNSFKGAGVSGDKLYEEILDLSEQLGVKREMAIAETKKLLTAGFKEEQLKVTIAAAADLSAVRGGEDGDELISLEADIKASGKISDRVFKSLGNMGVQKADVLSELRKSTKKSDAEIEAMLKSGALKADTLNAAISAAIENKYAGKAAESINTVSGQFERLQSIAFRLFDSVDAGPLVSALKAVGNALDSADGKALKSAISDLGKNVFTALFGDLNAGAAAKEIIRGIADGVRAMSEGVKLLTPLVQGFTKGFGQGLGDVGYAISKVFGDLKKDPKALENMRDLFIAAGKGAAYLAVAAGAVVVAIAGGVAVLGGIISAVIGGIVELVEWVENLGASIAPAGNSLGAGITDGMVAGIEGGAGAVISAITGVAGDAIAAAKRLLGIASPSKVFAEIGMNTAIGFAKGANDNASAASGAASSMVGGAAGAAGSAGASGASAGGAPGITNVYVTVQGAKGQSKADAEKQGEAIGRGITAALRRSQRDMAEQGASLTTRAA